MMTMKINNVEFLWSLLKDGAAREFAALSLTNESMSHQQGLDRFR